MPQNAAGMRHEPPVSVPTAPTAMPSDTETAAPDELPPAMRPSSRRHGASGVPKCGFTPRPEKANSVMLVRPTGTKPAANSRATTAACRGAGAASANTVLPAGVGSAATSSRSFRLTGSPAYGPGARPTRRSASTASACARAWSA